ncbi:type I modular polyketide synthase [Actinomyces sp. Chiba101]|nr:type I modular polyketide synthase [Actinomyces sp. Chiba101]
MRSAHDEWDRDESVLYRLAQTSGKPGAVDCVTPSPGAVIPTAVRLRRASRRRPQARPAAVVGLARIREAIARHSSEEGPSPSGNSTAR